MLPFQKRDKDDDDKKDDQAGIAQAMRQMSDQIAAMQQTINQRDATIAELRKQLGGAQTDDKADDAKIAELQRQLSAAQADDKADDAKVKALETQIAQLRSSAAAAASKAAASTSAGQAPQTPAPMMGLHLGGAAWVRNVGGKTLRRRAAPGLNSQILDGIEPGTMVALQGGPEKLDNYTWWEVMVSDGRRGWVAGEELLANPE
jgi:regulator of replication initiation timing